MRNHISYTLGLACGLASASSALAVGGSVAEPAGTLPVLREVDVVVVGGTSGGVAAAVAAAASGAKVFLAAPRPYLGEDICASYRLWLEPGEVPGTDLAKEVFAPLPTPPAIGPGLPSAYTADRPSAARHRDSEPPTKLKDGKWHSAAAESVQYDGDVTLDLDLGGEQGLARVHVLVYQRPGDFEVERVDVAASPDRKAWTPVATVRNEQPGLGFEEVALDLTAPVATRARHLRLVVKKTAVATRVLLGEVVVEAETGAEAPKPAAAAIRPVTPMQVKRVLDQALVKAGVPFLYGSHATGLLRDRQGAPAGIVLTNRSGRQAVLAKVIVDATERATVARLAGAEFSPYPPETQVFSRVVVGGEVRQGDSLSVNPRTAPIQVTDRKGRVAPLHEYRVQVPRRDDSFGWQAEVEQLARDWTWTPDVLDASEVLFEVPADSFRSWQAQTGPWSGPAAVELECFRPAGLPRFFALSGCAELARDAAAALVRPVNLMAVGARLGQAAAAEARRSPPLEGVRRPATAVAAPIPGQIRYVSSEAYHRTGDRSVPAEASGLPVLGEYDVVVVGGGTGGAPAAIGAGRLGAKTLVIEFLHGLGGVGTMGAISTYYHGNRVGFTKEVDTKVAALGGRNTKPDASSWEPEHKSEVYRRELRQARVDIWFGCMGAGAVVDGGRVKGVAVLTPSGPGVVLAKTVVDATGNADIAAAAGATCRYTDNTDVAVQGTGLPPRDLGQGYMNTDYTFVDETDVFDLWRVLVVAKQKFKSAYDLGQLVDTRERRQIVGDTTLSPMDMMLRRTYPDTVVIARSNFDTHGYIVHPLFMLRPPDRASLDVRVPYRCLLPRGLDGILVTGLGVSAHRDALPCIRMQADVQNQGYAAGVAAALVARRGCATREHDIKALQEHLVRIGNLPRSVLTETDSFPLPEAQVVEAVRCVAADYDRIEVVLARFDLARPLLREALSKADSEKPKLIYAHILGMMGDASGAEVLAKAVSAAAWDPGWRYTGMGQFGPAMSPLDSLIIALGRTRSAVALEPILGKAGQLTATSEFSHFRAVAMGLEALGDPAAARPLAALLRRPGVGGHAVTGIEAALENNPASGTDTTTRNQALSELYLARALYRCGDCENLGETVLRRYAADLHGHYARHAQAVLAQGRSAAADK